MNDEEAFRERLEQAKATSLGQALVKAARLFNERTLRRLRKDPRYAPVRARHLTIFPHLDLEGTRITTLAERMEMTKQGAGQLVRELEELGVVERLPDPSDGRAKLVCFTPRGREAMLDGIRVLRQTESALAEELGRAEMTRLSRSLVRIVQFLEAEAEADDGPTY